MFEVQLEKIKEAKNKEKTAKQEIVNFLNKIIEELKDNEMYIYDAEEDYILNQIRISDNRIYFDVTDN